MSGSGYETIVNLQYRQILRATYKTYIEYSDHQRISLSKHQQEINVRPASHVRIRTPAAHTARPVRLVRLNFPFTALWRPLRCNTPHFCSFLCGSVRSPRLPLAPSFYFLPSSLRPMTSHFCSFLGGSVRSPLPPDAIHLPPYRFSCTPQPPTFALFFADLSAVRLPPRHHSSSY